MITTRQRLVVLSLLLGLLLLGACGDGDGGAAGDTATTTSGLSAITASYDLAVGPPARFIVGLVNPDRGPVGFGTVDLQFFYLGEGQADGQAEEGPAAVATYLPLPGSDPAPEGTDEPAYLESSQRGVYAAEVGFDRAGFWGVAVTADLDGPQRATATFQVLEEHEVPAPGDDAIPSDNLTVDSTGVPPGAIDSRAGEGEAVPDPELHSTTVAQAMAAGRPVLLVISTPTYCVSQFCGPVTQMVADLAREYADRASFVHIEVWKDFEEQELNDAARQWIAQGENINEPWVFLIGADGKITARWDNVATRESIEPLLQELPAIAG